MSSPTPLTPDRIDRFVEKIMPEPMSGCWLWNAAIQKQGYGNFWDGDRVVLAHRFSYELYEGEIPDGLEIDHLCRNRACVNPKHLEPVTRRVNVRRGVAPPARCAIKTHCDHGHEFNAANTYLSPSKKRVCRACRRRTDAARYPARAEARRHV